MTQRVTIDGPTLLLSMPRRIKRYDNRKLYDPETSEYVSLDDIAELVRNGETVEVVDNATGQDITAQTLTQIILEEGKRGRQAIPSDLLHDVLRRSEEALDTGLEQIRATVDELLQRSLGRLQELVQSPQRQELDELRQQLRHLEHRLAVLLDDIDKGREDETAGTDDAEVGDGCPAPEASSPPQ